MVLLGTLLPMGGNRFFVAYVGALGVEVRVQVRHRRPSMLLPSMATGTPYRRRASAWAMVDALFFGLLAHPKS